MTSGATSGEVSEVYARYSFGVDSRRAEVIESCFTPTSALGVSGQEPTVGAKAIADRLVRIADPEAVHHAFNIVVVQAASDALVARADFTMAKQGAVFATGRYDDTLTKDPHVGWVFLRRVVTYTWRASTADPQEATSQKSQET